MEKLVVVLAIAMTFGMAAGARADAPLADGHTYAVLVGVADYPSSPLPRTDVDAERIANALRAHMPQERLRMHLLLNRDATRANVTRALSEVARDATERDEVIFFFSGHGDTHADEPDGDEGDGLDETIELFDGPMLDDELARQLAPIKSRMSIVALDSCFSGGFLFDVANERGRMAMFSSDEDLTSAVPSDEAGGWLSLYLAQALEGQADGAADGVDGQGQDGQLTALEIEMYVRDQFATQQRISASDPSSREVGYQNVDIKRTGVAPDAVWMNLDGEVAGGVTRNVVLEQTGIRLPNDESAGPTFDVSVEAGHTYVVETFDLEGATDTVLELTRGGSVLAQNDDAGGSLASRVQWTADRSGTVTARVHPYSSQTGGTFGLRVIELREGANAASRNVVLERGGVSLPGTMDAASLPSFPLTFEAGHTYVVETFDLAGDTDTVLQLRMGSGRPASESDRVVAENDDAGGTLASRVRWTARESGSYYALVRPYDVSTGGTFGIRVIELGGSGSASTPPSVPSPNTPNGGSGTVHVERRGLTLPATDDFDRLPTFEMELEAGRTYTIETFDLDGDTDTVLSLHRSTGGMPSERDPVLAENDDDGQSLASSLTFTPDQSGRYYAHVRPYGPETGGTFGFRVIER
ncbi:MAG: caspase family protein [Sandaracinaceae bacterium]|nr:caspase family protein [Sandaracinaceae bacterium]